MKRMNKREMKPILKAIEQALPEYKVEPDGYNEGFYIYNKRTKKSCRISVFGWEP